MQYLCWRTPFWGRQQLNAMKLRVSSGFLEDFAPAKKPRSAALRVNHQEVIYAQEGWDGVSGRAKNLWQNPTQSSI